MIILEVEGGLGNQMFQYAFGRACSLRLGQPLFLDLAWYRNERSKRKFLLDEMRVAEARSSTSRLLIWLLRLAKQPRIIEDNGFFEQEKLKDAGSGGNLFLRGWWESPLYWTGIEEELRKEFSLARPSEGFIRLSHKIQKDSIAVHVRRGDFVALAHAWYPNGVPYYERAVAHIVREKSLKDPKIVIFSDDPEWCRREMGELAGHQTEVFAGALGSDAEELMLMSLYGNNVIANSTFSWWAAFLNAHPDKIVVMPRGWHTDPTVNERRLAGIRVSGWIVLE